MIGNKKHFLVAGATGLVGTSLVEQLLLNPEVAKITLLVRKPTGVSNPKLTEKIIDFDTFSENALAQNVDAVFCCLGTTLRKAGGKEAFKRVDFDYVLKLAVYTQRQNIAQFHVISAKGSNQKATVFYNRVKGHMESELVKLDKIKSIYIYRPSLLLGDRGEFRFGEVVGTFFMKALSFIIPDSTKAIKDHQVAKNMLSNAMNPKKGVHYVENAEMINLG
ncbi:MAG: NAD(P)H-binding protein [Salibacteraceae bacterium]|jgi:uncharacterized protein YbjT (DUF2867 family)|nr:NAD(P)H-binding protein [Salibacteraceae bacterium]MDP4685377.1 NAD(P)H-binding protein [Salibacteraceae bacterium]MDP4763529.1 NAD(P)H-binding protein [Salibacteraceae bacterium]MDP4844358.1 NAD(P)H-binding protein [Salibacteraceae bacterium]MDP4935535.1 NAD(P)H-binding protein [Salibacteraceae bacterium]